MSVAIKASLYKTWHADPVEIRRFGMGEVAARSYAFLLEQVTKVFPSVTAAEDLTLAWVDADGDMITISSDEELLQALEYFKGNLFRLRVKVGSESAVTSNKSPSDEKNVPKNESQSRNSANPEQGDCFHPGVICDGCNGPIYGTRFKCMMCTDYDLCSSCKENGIHASHNMIEIGQSANFNPWIHAFSSGRQGGCGSFYTGGRRGHSNPFFHRGWGRGWGGSRAGGWGGGWGGRCGTGGWGGGWGGAGGWGDGGGPGGCPFFPGHGRQCRKPSESQSEANGTGPEPMDTEQKAGPTEENCRVFLRGMGEAVSNFLEPFGVKVDMVDVLGGGGGTTAEPKAGVHASSAATTVSEEVIETALAQLRSMGYEDEGGWLKELIRAKGGDVAKVLDALHPVTGEV